MGGGALLTPALVLLLGVPPSIAGSTPAAIALRASWPDAALWTGTLAELAAAPPLPEEQADAPGALLVGAVVSVAAALGEAGALDDSVAATDTSRAPASPSAAARAAGR
jgi:hypothetical protein